MKIFFLFCLLVGMPGVVLAEEVDVLRAIREDAEIARADKGMSDIYGVLTELLPSDEKETLKKQQRAWLNMRNESFDNDSPNDLLLEAYSYRSYDLVSLITRKIPVELVLQRPLILDYLGRRKSPDIESEYGIDKLPAFKALDNYLNYLESGRWVTTSYESYRGSIIDDIHADRSNHVDKMSYAPAMTLNDNFISDNLLPLYAWSFETLWNRMAYTKFSFLFYKTVREMEGYYKSRYGLNQFADESHAILASYIFKRNPENALSKSRVFALLSGVELSMNELKPKVTHFTRDEWNMALSIAVLRHYPAQTIEWMIDSGADVNALVYDETALMKAVDQPEIMAALMRKGANVHAENPFGKTALFYAVQFNQPASVKILVEARAGVNHPLHTLDQFEALYEKNNNYLLEMVAGFTPLIYSLRYASQEITAYLLAHGAKRDILPLEKYEAWVLAGNTRDEIINHPPILKKEIKERLAE